MLSITANYNYNYNTKLKIMKKQLLKDLKILKDRNIDELVTERINKFCSMGVVVED